MAGKLRSSTVCCLVAVSVLVLPVSVESKEAEHRLDSREYKLLLDTSKFTPDAPSAVNALWDDRVKTLIDKTLGRKDNGEPRYSSKAFQKSERRVVRFWDTIDPHRCTLNNNKYILRERVDLVGDQEKANDREVTLKLRDSDRHRVANTSMKGSGNDAKSKFEEDVSLKTGNTRSAKSMFSASTTIKKLKGGDTLSKMSNVMDRYRDLEGNLEKDGISIKGNETLAVVSDLSIDEEVYEGPEIDLGQVKADLSVSLWYNRAETPPTAPLIAELSFKYELDQKPKKVLHKARTRADALFEKLQTLDWLSPSSQTKTDFVYKYAQFCQ